jgi:sugar phosphate isomerase/epimerase
VHIVVSFGAPFDDKLAATIATGFDGIELWEPDLVVSTLAPEHLRPLLTPEPICGVV